MARHVLRIGTSVFALHPGERTMFVTFKHKEHAERTEKLVRHYLYTHKTLPVMTMSDNGIEEEPLKMNHEYGWAIALQDLHVGKLERSDIQGLCEMHNAGILDVEGMNQLDYGPTLNLSYQGYIEGPIDMSIENAKKYFEYLI